MKLYKTGMALRLVYSAAYLVIAVCMPLYGAFYPSTFSEACFRIAAILMAFSAVVPLGLAGFILTMVSCFFPVVWNSKKHVIRATVLTGINLSLWVLAVYFFVRYSGGA